MKLKSILMAAAAIIMITSCGSAKKASTSSTEYSNGRMAGAVLLKLAGEYLQTGKIDFSNMQNVLDIASLASSITSLKKEAGSAVGNAANTTSATLKDFVGGLEAGSNNAINNSNVNGIVSGLAALANSDISALTNSAEQGKDTISSLSSSLEGILSLFKK